MRVGQASETNTALPLQRVGRELVVSYPIASHKTAFGSSSVSGGGEVHASGYATHPETDADWLPPQLQRVALDVGLGAATGTVGAQVAGAAGGVIAGAVAVAWSRLRYPLNADE